MTIYVLTHIILPLVGTWYYRIIEVRGNLQNSRWKFQSEASFCCTE